MIVIVFIINLCFMIDFSWSECFSINSKKHGQLNMIERAKLPEKCIKGLSFQKKETGKMFCLKKGGQTDSLACAEANCSCGKENKPIGGPAEITGGDEVDRNQYPWYAFLLNLKDAMGCGGSLITANAVLTAAHCFGSRPERFTDFDISVALGMHNISGYKTNKDTVLDPSSFWDKNVISRKALEILDINQDSMEKAFDIGIIIIDPVRITKIISPVCLPSPEEVESLETKENVLVGFGIHKLWYQEYQRLYGKPLKYAQLVKFNDLMKPEFIKVFSEEKYQKEIIDGFFKVFFEIFPGIEVCVEKYEFVCQMTDEFITKLTDNIMEKFQNVGKNIKTKEFQIFQETTRNKVLPDYAEIINNWKVYTAFSEMEKIGIGYFSIIRILPMPDEQKENIFNSVKYVNQWLFIGLNTAREKKKIVRPLRGLEILRRARGKFISVADCKRIYGPSYCYLQDPRYIFVQRFSKEEGFACSGDSGGPIVVEKDGTNIVVAVVHAEPSYTPGTSWPPPCICCDMERPELQGRVGAALPWIMQVLEERNISIPCSRI